MLQNISGIEKCQEGERGGHHDLPSKICCLTVPSNFVGETCVAENFWYRKMLRIRERGGITNLSKFCCLTVQKIIVGETCISESFWYRKMLRIREREGGITTSVEILLSHSTENLRRGNLCFRKLLVSKIVKDKRERGASRLSLENLLSHRTEQLRRGNLCFRNFLVSKNVKDKRERGGCGITTFCRNFVVSQYRKSSSVKLVFQKVSGIEKC